jgi:hypothetical protein
VNLALEHWDYEVDATFDAWDLRDVLEVIAHSGEGGQGFRSIPDSNPTQAGQ